MLVLRGFGMHMKTTAGLWSPPFIFTLSLIDAALVIGLVLFFLRAHHESAWSVLFGGGHLLREAVLGIAVLPAIFMFAVLVLVTILRFAPHLHNVPHNPLEDMLRNRGDALMFAAVVMIAGGVREESAARLHHPPLRPVPRRGAVGVALYSVVLRSRPLRAGLRRDDRDGLLGAAWGLLYSSARSIVASIVSHAGFNLAQLLKYLAFAVR